MIIQQKIGNIQSYDAGDKTIDFLSLSWFETKKRILHKNTTAGLPVVMKFLKQDPEFSVGDIIYESQDYLVVIDILPCESIVIKPGSMQEMASLCYEIGNKHLPLFIDGDEILVPYELPLFNWLSASGFIATKEFRKLLHPVKTTTMAHSHAGPSLFTKILQLTKSNTDD